MIQIFDAVVLGVIEGLTEFLPISSTGHLIVASEFLGLKQDAITKAYEMIIQFAAILAVVLHYPSKFTFKYIDLWMKVALSFLPLGIIGFLCADLIKSLFSVQIVAVMFIIGGIVFIIVEQFYKEEKALTKDVEDITYKQSFYIGLAQVFALIPGTSRAGSSIIGAMLVKLNRKAAAEFSFLLAIPVLCATTAYDLLKHYNEFLDSNLLVLLTGFVVSFLVAYLAIKIFLRFLENFTFIAFGIYRIIFGIVLLILF